MIVDLLTTIMLVVAAVGGGRNVEQATAQDQLVGAMAVGEQAIVADAVSA